MLPSLSIRLLGCYEARLNGQDLVPNLKPCSAGLLAYLAWRGGRMTSRERLTEDLWRDLQPDRATRALSTTVWRLRRVIKGFGVDANTVVISCAEGVGLNPKMLRRNDVAEVEALSGRVAQTRVAEADDAFLAEVTEAVMRLGGEFLPGCYDDWSLLPREALGNRLTALQEFAVLSLMHRSEWRHALALAQSMINIDPMQECVHQWVITCHTRLGDRLRARAQYDKCAEIMLRELGVAPLPETTELHDACLAMGTASGHTGDLSPRVKSALRSLDAAREAFILLDKDLKQHAHKG